MLLYLLFGFLLILILFLIIIYNTFINLQNAVKNSWSGIDVQLKRRTNLIPNLVSVVKGYAKHEKELLERLTKERSKLIHSEDLLSKASINENLSGMLSSIFAVAENYPDLKANENFLKLQEQLSETEDQIAASRRIYNSNVILLNTKVESFPSNLVAKIFSFKKEEYFEISDTQRHVQNIKFN